MASDRLTLVQLSTGRKIEIFGGELDGNFLIAYGYYSKFSFKMGCIFVDLSSETKYRLCNSLKDKPIPKDKSALSTGFKIKALKLEVVAHGR